MVNNRKPLQASRKVYSSSECRMYSSRKKEMVRWDVLVTQAWRKVLNLDMERKSHI